LTALLRPRRTADTIAPTMLKHVKTSAYKPIRKDRISAVSCSGGLAKSSGVSLLGPCLLIVSSAQVIVTTSSTANKIAHGIFHVVKWIGDVVRM